jgi:hypothetical protein
MGLIFITRPIEHNFGVKIILQKALPARCGVPVAVIGTLRSRTHYDH